MQIVGIAIEAPLSKISMYSYYNVLCFLTLQIATTCTNNQSFAVGGKIPVTYTKYQFGGVVGLAYGSGGNSTSLFLNMVKQNKIDPYFGLYLSS